ncbi:pentatricopeptide repeat-containing protein At3g12770-like [Nymphaea colorata]|uniref:pentatricopeptide repeat-containing protein At3g12770-like n=1 Tax=Nymphaea colorata TaxID=210225 RepID=UPI00129D47E3|nr:pentatricopeptide repeat-containing protein At3g12770-like [Nymphaea colorata]
MICSTRATRPTRFHHWSIFFFLRLSSSISSSTSPVLVDALPAAHHTRLSLLLQCGRLSSDQLRQIHARVFTCGLLEDHLVATRLIGHLALSADVDSALRHFHQLRHPNVFPFNAIIRVVSQKGLAGHCFSLYRLLCRRSLSPNDFTFVFLLKAFSAASSIKYTGQIHSHVLKSAFREDVFVQTALLAAYAGGDVAAARQMFDEMRRRNVTTWTLLISAYAQSDRSEEALSLFLGMVEGREVVPNDDTMVSVLSACSSLSSDGADKWRRRFLQVAGTHCRNHTDTPLVYLFAKCADIEGARRIFDNMHRRTLVSWNVMITGYLQSGYPAEALALFGGMSVTPNHITMVAVLSACAKVGALEMGRSVHECILVTGPKGILESNSILATALIDMYVKCGSLNEAYSAFEKMKKRDAVAYNAMIMGRAIHGQGKDALALFSQMQSAGVRPNDVSLLAVLCACTHAGMVEEGLSYFTAMDEEYHVPRKLQHYTCLVDLLGRAGRIEEALKVMKGMPMEPTCHAWGALLGSCYMHSQLDVAMDAAEALRISNPLSSAGYVMISNMYAAGGQWNEILELRRRMKESGVAKEAGCSWISINGVVHEFLVGSKSHPEHQRICETLDRLCTVNM